MGSPTCVKVTKDGSTVKVDNLDAEATVASVLQKAQTTCPNGYEIRLNGAVAKRSASVKLGDTIVIAPKSSSG